MVNSMIYKKLKKEFNDSSDLKCKKINKVKVVYLESLCSSDKINEYILKNLAYKKNYIILRDNISAPNIVYIDKYDTISFYLLNGYALVYDNKDILVCEVKGDLDRGVMIPSSESSVNGPKDSFNENIVLNFGLIKRRIKSSTLINKDYFIGRKTQTKVSMLYMSDIAKMELVDEVDKKISNIDIDGLIDIEVLSQLIENNNNPLPTILKTERPDRVTNALLEGKIVLIADNSPYALILPAYFADFINPIGDKYVKPINVNFVKMLRFLCLIITVTLPAIYISIINYNPETIPLKLLLSFQAARNGVPFPSAFEAIFMIIMCFILREADIRFPSSYGSSISIIGALILGEAAVSANVVSPIMIIIIGITFISALVFSSGEMIDSLRYYRFLFLILSICLGLYGFSIALLIFIIDIASTKTLTQPYLFPLSPFNKIYLFKTILKNNKDKKRTKALSNNINKVKE